MNTATRIDAPRIDASTSDDALLAATAAGDRTAAAILFNRHAATLLAAARAVVGNHDTTIAEDATADVFVSLLEGRAATFQPARGRALAWLKGIATSTALEHLAARTSRRLKRPKKKSEGETS